MLTRIADFFEWFGNPDTEQAARRPIERALDETRGMMHEKDLLALGAIALHHRPRRIFEIGTYRGVTSNFLLSLLPDTEVVSIAYVKGLFNRCYNNSKLRKREVGGFVSAHNRRRFHQLFGDSHRLKANTLTRDFGQFDLVFIDGDHSLAGVIQDTDLAFQIISPMGAVCWHDANPRPKYRGVQHFLEEFPRRAIATNADYVGGIACWTREIELRLAKNQVPNHPPAGNNRQVA